MSELWAELLGAPRVRSGDTWHRFGSDKRFHLLALLGFKGGWVRREELSYLFWPDVPERAARHSLRQLLKRTRKLPWLAGLESDTRQVHWNVDSDVGRFFASLDSAAWSTAFEAYGGPLLEGMEGSGSPEFERWLEVERAHLHGLWWDAGQRLARRLMSEHRHLEAANLLSKLLEKDHLDEEALREYMAALARGGQGERALNAFRQFSSELRLELGVDPSPPTVRLVEEIRAARPSLTLEGPTVAAAHSPPALPVSSTPLVGREQELALLQRRLSDPACRLLTILGPGGAGKTRLAVEAARMFSPSYEERVHLVPLESVQAPSSLPAAIAAVLTIQLAGGDHLAQLAQHIGEKRMLIVLDSCEHLTSAAADLTRLLDLCPGLDLLLTSRERLSVEREWLLPLEGLDLPQASAAEARTIRQSDSVRLLVESAHRLRPGFRLDDSEASAALEVCRLVEGLPLGIELASAWTRVLSLEQIASEVARNYDFLSSGERRAGSRHGSIRAVFEHSWSLLREDGRVALRKLAVFAGGLDREAAEYVVEVKMAQLVALADKSLLRASGDGRFDRHPLLHQYMREKLAEHPTEEHASFRRHSSFFLSLAERASAQLRGPQQAEWLARLEREHDNLRSALLWSLDAGDVVTGMRLVAALAPFWERRGYSQEGSRLALEVLERAHGTEHRQYLAKTLHGAGVLLMAQAKYPSAGEMFERALAIWRDLGDQASAAAALNNLGNLGRQLGDRGAAREYHQKSLALKRKLGDTWGAAMSLNNLGTLAWDEGDHEEATRLLGESLAMMNDLGDERGCAMASNNLGLVAESAAEYEAARSWYESALQSARDAKDTAGVARLLNNLGRVSRKLGKVHLARELVTESLELRWRLGNPLGVANCFDDLAALLVEAGEHAPATRLLAAAQRQYQRLGTQPRGRKPDLGTSLDQARAALGDSRYRAEWELGRTLKLEELVDFALTQANALSQRK